MAGRLRWQTGRVVAIREETPSSKTILFDVPGWPGHLAGQHVDLRLTAEDGYSAERSYSIAGPVDGERVELTVQRVPNGEVSTYLVDDLRVGDELELRGPIGGWFVWRVEELLPVLLVAGGSGVVPLMAMVRERARTGGVAPFTFVYSARSAAEVYYADELAGRARDDDGLTVSLVYTRSAPAGSHRPAGRIGQSDPDDLGWKPGAEGRVYVCGPTGFVEAVVGMMLDRGHDPSTIRTERFGPTGG
ncbi:ferredoxin reductase [Rugosimonospora africana]|uniref:Oxidoreductase n=1 Tax=Rugosimonospora africana TaxID=556532 RepID=A0A8J3R4W0_9ACTN|nr:ferredoxin reductase [Rugosimonospora africana]GIH21527.1 oxidoreductase [Rugosimonospora africana]